MKIFGKKDNEDKVVIEKDSSSKMKGWHLTDNIIKIEAIIPHQFPNFGKEYNLSGDYTCIRDYKGNCLYIKSEEFELIQDQEFIFNMEHKLVNLTHLDKYKTYSEHFAIIANKTVPYSVRLKTIESFRINNIIIYSVSTTELEQEEQLFKDLINVQIMKDNYKLD